MGGCASRSSGCGLRAGLQETRYWLAHSVTIRQAGDAPIPIHRLAYYLGFALLAALAAATSPRAWMPLIAPLTLAAGLAAQKALFVAILPGLAIGISAALLLLALGLCLGLPRGFALGCALAGCLRILAVLHPAFPSVDSTLHRHRLDQFRSGQLVTNIVGSDEMLTRLAPALAEASAPLLLFLLARSLGSGTAAFWAALALAFMPEGMLVVAKGITANAIGLWATLWALIALHTDATW